MKKGVGKKYILLVVLALALTIFLLTGPGSPTGLQTANQPTPATVTTEKEPIRGAATQKTEPDKISTRTIVINTLLALLIAILAYAILSPARSAQWDEGRRTKEVGSEEKGGMKEDEELAHKVDIADLDREIKALGEQLKKLRR